MSVYIDSISNKVFRCSKDSSKPTNEWNNFEEMLESEYNRICELFDEDGKIIDKDKPTIPG